MSELPPCGRASCTARHCSATSKQKAKPCGNHVKGGAVVCRSHGGKAPQVLAKAKRRQLAAEALADIARMGVSVECTPIEALEAMLHEAAGNVVVLRELVAQLPTSLGAFADDDGIPTLTAGIAGRTKLDTLEAKPHVLVVMYGEERDRLARLAKDCAALGIDERRVTLAEADARRMYEAVSGALDAASLSAGQQEAFRVALAGKLRSLVA